jgi:hypothetical protein
VTDSFDAELPSARRRELHLRRLGSRAPECSHPGCLERDPAALTGVFPNIACYEHDRRELGLPTWEGQHPSGEANDPDAVIPLPGNDHRVWDDAKRDWPDRTLRNPDGSPLLRAAAAVRSLLDWFNFIAERLLGWIAPFLERLDEALRSMHGDEWWTRLGLDAS